MDVRPRSPLEPPGRWESAPTRDYHVVFWRQPLIPDDVRARGIRQKQIMWSSSEWDVVDAEDVHEVIAWADDEARRRHSIYALYAVVMTERGEGIVWIAGHDPSVTGRNFRRRRPPDVDPVH